MEREFQSVKFGEGTLAVLESHPHYQCVQRMADLRPELRSRGQVRRHAVSSVRKESLDTDWSDAVAC